MLLNELVGIKYPIFQGAMANISDASFAACVSNAGALGIIATGSMNHEQVREEIRKCKSLTDKPFGVNVMLMNPESPKIIDVIIEEGVSVVTTGAGNPGVYIEPLKKAGIKVFPVIGNVSLARRLARNNIDGLIVEGTESGGHVGEATTMALLPQMIRDIKLPIIAAGGIATGGGLIAAMALGAVGVQIGTCLLVSNECPIHSNYKEAIIRAKDSDTIVTGRSKGVPVRVLKNQMSIKYISLENEGATKDELEHLTMGGLRKAVTEGDVKNGSLMSGQIAGLCKEVRSLKEIIEGIISEAKELKGTLNNIIDKL